MQQIVSITDARNNLSRLVAEVASQNKRIVIVRDSLPEAVLVPYARIFADEEKDKKKMEKEFSLVLSKLRKTGRTWLKNKGIDWKKMTEEEQYALINKI